MMPLASSGIDLTYAVIAAVIYGVYKLIAAAAGAKPDALKPPPMPPSAGNRGGSIHESREQEGRETEEERTRKFLEALGLPANTLQPKAAQETMRPANPPPRRPGSVPPVPPFVPEAMRGGRGSIPHGVPEPTRTEIERARQDRKRRHAEQQRRPAQPPAIPAAQVRAYDGAIERIHFAELKTPETPAFHTRSSDVSAIPFELAESVAGKLYLKEGTARQLELIALARSPKALRQAILIREVLGPPRSLQSDFAAPNLAPL
jgi:hypothetical protein